MVTPRNDDTPKSNTPNNKKETSLKKDTGVRQNKFANSRSRRKRRLLRVFKNDERSHLCTDGQDRYPSILCKNKKKRITRDDRERRSQFVDMNGDLPRYVLRINVLLRERKILYTS